MDETQASAGSNRQAILAVVQERAGVTAGEIAVTAGIASTTVSKSR
jgi:predicted ArsR family transcriptional regulator